MSELIVTVRPGTWSVEVNGLVLTASGVIRDRATIRATVEARRDGALVFRSNVNLTGDRGRAQYLKRLNEFGARVPDMALLTLDEAIRQTPRSAPTNNGHYESMYDGSPEFSGKVPDLAELEARVYRWLLIEDSDVLTLVLASAAGHRLGGESPWLLLVAPPSGTKTEILRMLWRTPGIYPLSELTERTFASGLDTQGDDPSLLARLRHEILVVKDLTTILELRHETRQAILAQLREIYDGRFDKTWGTGKELHWQGRLGFLAGVTPVIDQHHAVMALLGPRFLLLRMKEPDREGMANRAMENTQRETQMRAELAGATAAFLQSLPTTPPTIGPEVTRWLARVADVVTRARSPVIRDGYKRELDYAPEPELPARLAKQLYALLQGLIIVRGRTEVAPEDLLPVARVAFDCIPRLRGLALRTLGDGVEPLSTTEVAARIKAPTQTSRRALEDLQALGLALCEKGGKGKPDRWWIGERTRMSLAYVLEPATICDVGTVPENSGPPSYTESAEAVHAGRVAGAGPGPAVGFAFDDLPFPTGAVSAEGDDTRETHCWRCKQEISEDREATCPECGWIICSCGACMDGCELAR